MKQTETEHIVPDNFDELKKQANRTSNWRERLDAVNELGQINSKQAIDLLTRIMNNDAVYKVQETAYRNLKRLGQDVTLPPRKKFDLIRDVNKVLVRIKKSLPEGHSYEDFKEKLKKMRLDLYDTYEGDKGADFDKWLETTWESLLKK